MMADTKLRVVGQKKAMFLCRLYGELLRDIHYSDS